ncbi:MAG: hypothetical protein ACKVON_16120, partial [Beijerinckiaceae bacterium]
SRAERDKAWVADGRVSETWSAVSPVTGTLGGYAWTRPPQAPGAVLLEEIVERRGQRNVSIETVALASPPAMDLVEKLPAEQTPAQIENVKEEKPTREKPGEAVKITLAPDDPGAEETSPKKKWRLLG